MDLCPQGLPKALVRWTSFNRELGVYEGKLQHKTQYMKRLLEIRTPEESYDRRRIEAVLDALVHECISIAEAKKLAVTHIKSSL